MLSIAIINVNIILNIWRFQPQGRGDLFNPALDRDFGLLRTSLTDRGVVEESQLQKVGLDNHREPTRKFLSYRMLLLLFFLDVISGDVNTM